MRHIDEFRCSAVKRLCPECTEFVIVVYCLLFSGSRQTPLGDISSPVTAVITDRIQETTSIAVQCLLRNKLRQSISMHRTDAMDRMPVNIRAHRCAAFVRFHMNTYTERMEAKDCFGAGKWFL